MDLTLLLGERGLLTNDWRVLPLTQVMNEFLKSIPAKKEHTRRAYRSDWNFLLAFMGKAERIDRLILGDRDLAVLQNFVHYRLKQGEAPSTIDRRINSQRSFDTWFRRYVPHYPCPALDVRTPEVQKLSFKGLTPDDAKKLKAGAYALELRHGICVDMLLSTGIRRAELLRATEAQLSTDLAWIRNLECKGDYYRDVYIPEPVRPKLARWLNERDRILKRYRIKSTLPYPIIVSVRGANAKDPESFVMDGKTLWRIVAESAMAAGIEHVSPHMCRHTRAHEIYDESNDIRLVQQAMGHRSLQTTVRYTERTHEDLAARLEEAQRK